MYGKGKENIQKKIHNFKIQSSPKTSFVNKEKRINDLPISKISCGSEGKDNTEDTKSFLYKNLQEVLQKVGNECKSLPKSQDNETIYLKVEECSGVKQSIDFNDR